VPFEVFTKRLASQAAQPHVTIARGGKTISFNEAAYLAMGKPEAVELLFDRQAQIMGLRPAATTNPDAYPVLDNSRGTTHMVTGQMFTRHYGIATDVARRWPAVMEKGDLCVDLKDAGVKLVPRRVQVAEERIPGVGRRKGPTGTGR
jgi:hypothetical protein